MVESEEVVVMKKVSSAKIDLYELQQRELPLPKRGKLLGVLGFDNDNKCIYVLDECL